MVRFDPAGTVMVRVAVPLTMGMLNTSIVGMSGAVTSATTVATMVPERLTLTASVASPAGGPTVLRSAQDTSTARSPKATDTDVSRLLSIGMPPVWDEVWRGKVRARNRAHRRSPGVTQG